MSQRWIFTVQLPDGLTHPGRYMAAVLKHLLRHWRVKATAILDAPADVPGPDNAEAPSGERGAPAGAIAGPSSEATR